MYEYTSSWVNDRYVWECLNMVELFKSESIISNTVYLKKNMYSEGGF